MNWLNLFLNKSENFKIPTLIEGVIENDLPNLREFLFKSLKNLMTQEPSPYGIWIDGANRNEIKPLIKEGIEETTAKTLDNFFQDYFEGLEFGIVAHHTNAYDEGLAMEMFKYTRELIKNLGTGVKGVDLNVFIGNYGWTPFGIHQDGKGENVIHFHLGPGIKTMYLWTEEKYKKIENLSFEEKIELSDFCFKISPGDLFFMPEGFYHIGYTPDYSVAITTWFCSPTEDTFKNKIIRELLGYINDPEESNLLPLYNNLTEDIVIKDIYQKSFSDIENSFYKNLDIETAIELKIKEFLYKLESSLFYTWPFIYKTKDYGDLEYINLKGEVKILYFIEFNLNKIFVFFKGYQFVMEYNDYNLSIIISLNNKESINFRLLKNDFFFIHELLNKNLI